MVAKKSLKSIDLGKVKIKVKMFDYLLFLKLSRFCQSFLGSACPAAYSFLQICDICLCLFSDNFIQRTKQKYNSTRSLTVRIDIGELTQELQRNPPYQVTEADIGAKTSHKSAPISIKGTVYGTLHAPKFPNLMQIC